MPEQKRRLNIPIYDVKSAPDIPVLDDDVIDVEVLPDAPSRGERLRSRVAGGARAFADTAREARVNGARDAFFTQPADRARAAAGRATPGAEQRETHRAQQRERAQAKAAQTSEVKAAQAARSKLEQDAISDPAARLRLDVIRAGEQYMHSIRTSGVLGAGQTKASQRKQLAGLHQVYASMMVLQCVKPLQQGLSGENVVSALGMAASMWMLSPDFRTQVGSFVGQVGDGIRAKIDARESAKDDKARDRRDSLVAKGKGADLASKWKKRLERIEFAERGHRLPFNAQSAAMTEVALAEAAYKDMRRPGADADGVHARYKQALSALYDYAEEDGLTSEDVSRSMRTIVGRRLEKEPELANVFAELGHGRFEKAPSRENSRIWAGDYSDVHMGWKLASGSFSVRPVMDVDEHRVLAMETMAAEMSSAQTPAEINDVLTQYMVAASVGEYPDAVDQVEGAVAQRRFGRVRTMFASMKDDGLSSEDQHFAYSTAYCDAIELTQALNPELGAAWMAQYGADWRAHVEQDITRFKDMGRAAERAKAEPERENLWDGFTPEAAPTREGEHSPTAEDIVDAEVVDEAPPARTRVPRPPRSSKEAGKAARPGQPGWTSRNAHLRVEDSVHEGELITDENTAEDDIVDAEIVEDLELSAAEARKAILARAATTAPDPEQESTTAKTNRRVRAARVNQRYNEIETGRILGIGSDKATPIQDPDFELG